MKYFEWWNAVKVGHTMGSLTFVYNIHIAQRNKYGTIFPSFLRVESIHGEVEPGKACKKKNYAMMMLTTTICNIIIRKWEWCLSLFFYTSRDTTPRHIIALCFHTVYYDVERQQPIRGAVPVSLLRFINISVHFSLSSSWVYWPFTIQLLFCNNNNIMW